MLLLYVYNQEVYFYIMHHLKVEVVRRALQDERGPHVGCGIVEVEDDIISVRAALRSKHLIYFLGSLNFVRLLVSVRGTVEKNM